MTIATIVLLLTAVIALSRLRAAWFCVALLVAMWTTRWEIPVAGFGVRIENLVGAAAVIKTGMLLRDRSDRLQVPRTVLVAWASVGTWLALAVVTAVLASPETLSSVKMIVWAGGGFVTAVWLGLNSSLWRWTLLAGTWIALAAAVLGVAAWIVSTAGLATLLVQPDPSYGGLAAYGMSHEANLFAGLVCLWAVVSAFNPGGVLPLRLRLALLIGAPIAIVAAHTRASLVALGLAMAVWLLSTLKWSALLPVGAVVVLLGLAFPFVADLDQGLEKFAQPFDLSTGTGVVRLSSSAVALDEWADEGPRSWLLGLGFNSFGQRNLDPTRPLERIDAYVATLPVQLLYDGGAVAVVLILLAVGATAYPLLRSLDHISALTVAVTGAYFTISLATSSMWFLQTWVLAGLAWAAAVRISQHETRPTAVTGEAPA